MNKRFSLSLVVWTLVLCSVSAQTSNSVVTGGSSAAHFYDGLIFSDGNFIETRIDGGLMTSFLHPDLIRNDYWSEDIISAQKDHLSDQNRFGARASASVLFHQRNKRYGTNGPSPFYGVRHDFITSFTANRDIMLTALEGNSDHLSMEFNQYNGFETYQASSLLYGLEFSNVEMTTIHRVALSVIAGNRWSNTRSQSGRIDTDSSGEFVKGTNTDISYNIVDNEPLAGFGAALHYTLAKNNDRSMWRIDLNNLGVVNWATVRQYSVSPDFVFEGFDVSDAIRNSDEYAFLDSLNKSYVQEKSSSEIRIIPFQVEFIGSRNINTDSRVSTQISYLYTVGYYPKINLNYHQAFSQNNAEWKIGASIGGYGNYALQLGLDVNLGSKGGFRLDVTGMETLIPSSLPVYWYGKAGCFFRL